MCDSPLLRDRSPLILYKTYPGCLGEGLLPTPNIRPLRRAIYVHHPVIELERVLNETRLKRNYSILRESNAVPYAPGINLKYKIGVYGEKIARLSNDSDEACKRNIEDQYSPRTQKIWTMLEEEAIKALQNAGQDRSNSIGEVRRHKRRTLQ
jgi:hypothetical protein